MFDTVTPDTIITPPFAAGRTLYLHMRQGARDYPSIVVLEKYDTDKDDVQDGPRMAWLRVIEGKALYTYPGDVVAVSIERLAGVYGPFRP